MTQATIAPFFSKAPQHGQFAGFSHNQSMEEVLHFLGQVVEIKRRRFQKRLGVSVYPNGRIRVSANKSIRLRQILIFLEEHKDWLSKSLSESENLRKKYPPKEFRSGELYPLLGKDYHLRVEKGEKSRLQFLGDQLCFFSPIPEENWNFELRTRYFKALKKSYRQVAENLMSQRMAHWKEQMGLRPKSLHFRDQKTIWGSCSAENKISLNFKLIVAPIEVVDYVIIHELSHIRHKDHSKKFWSLVESMTEHRHFSRGWLRENQFKADFLARNSELQLPAEF